MQINSTLKIPTNQIMFRRFSSISSMVTKQCARCSTNRDFDEDDWKNVMKLLVGFGFVVFGISGIGAVIEYKPEREEEIKIILYTKPLLPPNK